MLHLLHSGKWPRNHSGKVAKKVEDYCSTVLHSAPLVALVGDPFLFPPGVVKGNHMCNHPGHEVHC
jgi:hypothetical protein